MKQWEVDMLTATAKDFSCTGFYLIKVCVMTDCQYFLILQPSSDAVRTYYIIKKNAEQSQVGQF